MVGRILLFVAFLGVAELIGGLYTDSSPSEANLDNRQGYVNVPDRLSSTPVTNATGSNSPLTAGVIASYTFQPLATDLTAIS